jgi:hypothetical protein
MDDPLHPHQLGEFRDWQDFVDRVARPLIEADGDDTEQAAMALYRKASPYFICVSMVMMANRIAEQETLRAGLGAVYADADWVDPERLA